MSRVDLQLVKFHPHTPRPPIHQQHLVYTQLVAFKDDEYISKVATSADEACKLVEAGFEHVCEINATHIFRKRE